MPAFCALCTRELTKGEPFVLSGFEVFHTKCVKARGTQGSVGNRERVENARLRQEITRLQSEAEDLHAKYGREVVALRNELRNRADVESEYRRQRNEARAERDTLNGAVTAANARADNYARELALMRTLAAPSPAQVAAPIASAPPAPATPATPAESADHRDATEIRFSLLELDPS